MKTIIAFFLFGFTYVLALPNCQKEYEKCSEKVTDDDYDDFMELDTVQALDEVCRLEPDMIQCHLDVMKKCPNADFIQFKDANEEAKRIYGILCDKANLLRKKFVNNIQCLNKFAEDFIDICNNGERIDFKKDKEACTKLRRMQACAEKSVGERCGADAKETYLVLEDPNYDLRQAKCL